MDFQQQQIVLVDTNVILEAHQTGYQNRDPEHWIDEAMLRGQLTYLESVTEIPRVTFNMTHGHPKGAAYL